MKHKLLFLVALISFSMHAQGPPPPCWFGNMLEGCDETHLEGFAVFNFEDANEHLFCDLVRSDYSFPLYFETQENAYRNLNPIVNYQSYRNTSDVQRIYSRLNGINSEINDEFRYFHLITEGCLSISEFHLMDYTMYPNPANSTVNIQFNTAVAEKVLVSIYNLQGKLVNKPSTISNESEIRFNVSNLSQGMYFVELQGESFKVVEKLIIE